MREEQTIIGQVARHPVAPNVLMLILIVAGIWAVSQLNIRFFPRFEVQRINITAPWSGASAEDVEKSLVIPLENELRNVPNLESMQSSSSDGRGAVYLEFPESVNLDRAAEDVRQYVDQALSSLPADADAPEVRQQVRYDDLMRLSILGGDLGELRRLARRFENELTQLGVARVDINGLPKEEIQIVANRGRLVELDATVRDIGKMIAAQNRDMSAGNANIGDAEGRLRALAKSESVFALAEIPVISRADGGMLRLGDIADIRQVVPEGEKTLQVNGRRAVELRLRRRDQDSTLDSARAVLKWVEETRATLPPGSELLVHDERWRQVESRLTLLLDNGAVGLLLVLLTLFLFMSGRVAFWIAAGIPVIFLATLFVMKIAGGSINMISMFALIMATGIIVDDSIVVGENAAHHLSRGMSPLRAAVHGAREMFAPVFAATFTTVSSFLPILIVGGTIGSIISDIPFVIICILIAALFECFLILPGHLYHSFRRGPPAAVGGARRALDAGFVFFQEKMFRPLAAAAVKFRFATICACVGMVIFSISLFMGGLVKYRFFPGAERGSINAEVAFVAGTPEEAVREYVDHLLLALRQAEERHPEEEDLVRFASVYYGSGGSSRRPISGEEVAQIRVEMSSSEERELPLSEFAQTWRKLVKKPAGLERLSFREQRGGPSGGDLEVRLSGDEIGDLKAASLELQEAMRGLPGVSQVQDDTPFGRDQIGFELTPLGSALGLSTEDVAAQLRDALSGYKAQTFHQNADEVDVRVFQADADSTGRLESFQIRLPAGGFAALEDVVELRTRRGFDAIARDGGRPAINVTGEVDFDIVGDMAELTAQLRRGALGEIVSRHGVEASFEGRQADQRKTLRDMQVGLLIALVLIYIILTWVFASWSVPVVIMLTMPLGLVGAVVGHWLTGHDMSILSFFGVFALMGIIVNDSIVLVQYFAHLRREHPEVDADRHIVDSACRRLRAVLVTSLTTIGGLFPLMFETSRQAQFLIPMAVSICFGLAFATLLILLFTPACLSYHQTLARFFRGLRGRLAPSQALAAPRTGEGG